jgi:hypothetical protein
VGSESNVSAQAFRAKLCDLESVFISGCSLFPGLQFAVGYILAYVAVCVVFGSEPTTHS